MKREMEAIAGLYRAAAGLKALASGHWVGLELIERLQRPTWIISEGREVVGHNARAAESMKPGFPFRKVHGRLGSASPVIERELSAHISSLLERERAGEVSPRTAARLEHDGRRAVISVSLFEPRSGMHAFGQERRFMVMLHDTARHRLPDTLLWEAAFDLTPAESRVAARLTVGMSLADLAQDLGIGVSTVRSHLLRAYQKTGAKNQADLVRILLLSGEA